MYAYARQFDLSHTACAAFASGRSSSPQTISHRLSIPKKTFKSFLKSCQFDPLNFEH
jgi:hypothetical protein